jgi:hypothetical protein
MRHRCISAGDRPRGEDDEIAGNVGDEQRTKSEEPYHVHAAGDYAEHERQQYAARRILDKSCTSILLHRFRPSSHRAVGTRTDRRSGATRQFSGGWIGVGSPLAVPTLLRSLTPPAFHQAEARAPSSIATVAVMPAVSTTPGGTSSIWMRTGMRWARGTQVKMGLTVATP